MKLQQLLSILRAPSRSPVAAGSRHSARWLGALLLAFVVAGLAGCAEERAPINRVQPLYLKKAFFLGADLVSTKDDPEFWARATVVDVGYGAAQDGLFTSTYAQPLSRIKWQVTEDLLIGRLSYERIQGSDGKGVGKAVEDGVIVCAFRIQSQFDIRHAYNTTTGEEINVLEENAIDRPWYQREYIRVDWSKNLNTDSYDFDTLSMMGIYGGISYEGLAYDVQDPSDEAAPFFAKDGSYFDITTKAFAKPGVVDLSHLGWGIDSFPSCFLDADFSGGTAPAGSCNPIELTLRHSFRRVVDTDYEPQQWDGFRFQAAGAFTVDRSGYTRNYGMTDDAWYRMIERYNVWNQSHVYYAADKTGKVDLKQPVAYTAQGATPVKCYVPTSACNGDASCVGTPYGQDPHRDANNDGTEDECAAIGSGSRCDTFRQRCTLPYAQRQEKTIVWYTAEPNNPTYYQASEDAAHEWDVAMRLAVRTAKYAECSRLGGTTCATLFPTYNGQQTDNDDAIALAREVDDCRHGIAYKDLGRDETKCAALADSIGAKRGSPAGVIAIAKAPEMVVLCHSPVEANDAAACAPADKRLPANMTAEQCGLARANGDRTVTAECDKAIRVRRGDLRYNAINNIVEPATPSPWGIMVDGHDPLTGEEVAASINVWTYINDLWSQGVVDMSRYVNGELKTADITEGKYIKDWSVAAQAAVKNGMAGQMDEDQVRERVSSSGNGKQMTPEQMRQFMEQNPGAMAKIRETKAKLADVRATNAAPSSSAPAYLARRTAAAGTAFEAALMTPMMQKLNGIAGLPLSQGLMDMASPMRGGNPAVQRGLRQLKQQALADRGACIMEMADAPLAIAGLADVLQEKFGKFNANDNPDVQQARAERMRKYLSSRVHYAVIIHEMGHSMALRHNFISSADAWGYRPQYWQLRSQNGAETKLCSKLSTDGSTCIGPRWFDPVTKQERDGLVWMWMQSSVMDYAGESTQDMLGLGAYDFHAVRMFYGDVATVHADDSYLVGTKRGVGMLAKEDNFGGIIGLDPAIGSGADTNPIHYSDLQNKYALIGDCTEAKPADWQPGRWNVDRDGAFHPLLDGLIPKIGETYTRCKQQVVDYVPWASLRSPVTTASAAGAEKVEFSGYYRGGPAVDAAGRVRLPYGFATDTWADLGNASVYRHDNGADNYEIFNFMKTQAEVNHIFDNYRRGRHSFTVRGAFGRSLSRYYEKMRDGAKGLGLYRNIYNEVAAEAGLNPDDLWTVAAQNYFQNPILAAGMVFDHFTMIEQRPEIGPHYLDADSGVLKPTAGKMANSTTTDLVTIPNGATGYMGNVGLGGRLVENTLADNKGEYDSQYTMNAGSYYEKSFVAMLLAESVDNFISSSLQDFTDSRYRSVSVADLFPDGYRRFMANALTGDEDIKGARIASSNQKPAVDGEQYPSLPIGFTSWWGATPQNCFPADGTTICRSFGSKADTPYASQKVPEALPINSQIGFEQQKFLIAWTMLYLFENQKQDWIDKLRIWELGIDANPELGAGRIELHYPGGKTYVARTFGTEVIFGKTVQKGIAARVLEYANGLVNQAYETTPGPDSDGDGKPDWYEPKLNPKTGTPLVKYDAAIKSASGAVSKCTAKDNSACVCEDNRICVKLKDYMTVPAYLREAIDAYQLGGAHQKGVF